MEAWRDTMKLTKSRLQQIIQEELEAELEEEKERHFSPSQSPAEADKTFHDCIEKVKKTVEPRGGDTKEEAAAKICTDARKVKGATLDWGKKREKEVEKARPGGKSGK